MHKKRFWTYHILGTLCIVGLSACYQQNASHNNPKLVIQEIDFLNDSDSDEVDNIEYIDTFKLLPTQEIVQSLLKNTKRKVAYKLPPLPIADSLKNHKKIENLAVAQVYATVGKLTNNKLLLKSSVSVNEEIITKLVSDSLVFPKQETLDSIKRWTQYVILENHSQEDWAYFEAIQWLENLFITVENHKNVRSITKLQELVELQMENGAEMLERLSMYQSYQPIKEFTNYLIDILDCKYYDFNPSSLLDEITSTRQAIYTIDETNK